MRFPLLYAAFLVLAGSHVARAWDYEGHRVVNQLAVAALPGDFPSFVRTPEARERLAYLSGEPDRWRATDELVLRHINPPDHFFDIEEVEDAGLERSRLSEFRYVFVVDLATARAAHPDRFLPVDPAKNVDHTRELAGFLPWAIAEKYALLRSQCSLLKAYVEAGSAEEVANAQANILQTMGLLGHYVADAAQPLHTTKYYNGWIGPNPHGYTTARTFHAWIDGGFFKATGGLSTKSLRERVKPAAHLALVSSNRTRSAAFSAALDYVYAGHDFVEPLYTLEKEGKLDPSQHASDEGRRFLEERLLAAAQMLGSLWLTAWNDAPVDTYLRDQLVRRSANRRTR